jgi:hypothetical protein
MSQMNSFGGLFESIRNLTDQDTRLLQLSQNLANTFKDPTQKRRQGLLNLLGQGSNIRTGLHTDPHTSYGGLGGLLDYLG